MLLMNGVVLSTQEEGWLYTVINHQLIHNKNSITMKKTYLLALVVVLLGLAFQSTPKPQYAVYGYYATETLGDSPVASYLVWNPSTKDNVLIKGEEDLLRFLNAQGLKVVSSHTTGRNGQYVVFVVE
jgi:hypothetical protein